MFKLSLEDIEQAGGIPGTRVLAELKFAGGEIAFGNASQDSRQINSGDLFIALGKRSQIDLTDSRDGNRFIDTAISARKARWAVSDRPELVSEQFRERLITTDNSLVFLQRLAKIKRRLFSGSLIGITGTSGKTTTKEMLGCLVAANFKTRGNYNNHIGLPLELLHLSGKGLALVEMGMNHPGEIEALCEIAGPDMGIITTVGPGHLAGMKTGKVEEVAEAKLELARSLPRGGVLIYDGANRYLNRALKQDCYQELHQIPVNSNKSFGYNRILNINAGHTIQRIYFRQFLSARFSRLNLKTPFMGIGQAKSLSFAVNSAIQIRRLLSEQSFSQNVIDLIERLDQLDFSSGPGRMRLLGSSGRNLILDDCYNSNPLSLEAALETISRLELPGEYRRGVVLGDMLELGRASARYHRQAGKSLALNSKIDFACFLGEEMELALQEYQKKSEKGNPDLCRSWFPKQKLVELAELIQSKMKLSNSAESDLTRPLILLIKGSRSMEMEKLIPGDFNPVYANFGQVQE